MRRALSVCLEPGCPALVPRGRCAEHARPSRWGQGNRGNARSSSMRARVLEAEPTCRYCGMSPATQVDHIIPLAEGGSSERDNLAGVCASCHAKKTRDESMRRRDRDPYTSSRPGSGTAPRPGARGREMKPGGAAHFVRDIDLGR